MKTREEYLKAKPNLCPNCDSDEIEGGSLTVEGKVVFQNCNCLSCNCEWCDQYTLNDFSVVNVSPEGEFEREIERKGFTLSYNHRKPQNTVGVDFYMYYPTVDGVEVGSVCDTPQEALVEAEEMLSRTAPYSLKEIVGDHVDHYTLELNRRKLSVQQKETIIATLSKLIPLLAKLE